jgi:hypothetical protein
MDLVTWTVFPEARTGLGCSLRNTRQAYPRRFAQFEFVPWGQNRDFLKNY